MDRDQITGLGPMIALVIEARPMGGDNNLNLHSTRLSLAINTINSAYICFIIAD